MTTSKNAESSSATTPKGVKNAPTVEGAVPYEEANKDNLAIPPNTESPVVSSAEAATATIAARNVHLAEDSGIEQFDKAVGTREGKIEAALQQRAADVKAMQAEAKDYSDAEAERAERARDGDTTLAASAEPTADSRVPVTPETLRGRAGVAANTPVGPGPAPRANRVPGTGVADPRDLAPGQDLSPSPPGGVAITPLPDKPGTNYSAL